MEKFSLIKALEQGEKTPKLKESGIVYQRYDLPVDDKEMGVLIPIRECEAFEASLEDFSKVDFKSLKQLLRKHRGLRVREE